MRAFEGYINWAYSDTLVAESTVSRNIDMMIDLYLLGDKLDDIKLRNKTLKALHSYATIDKTLPGAQNIGIIWEGTPSSSPLRRWALDSLVARRSRKGFERSIARCTSRPKKKLDKRVVLQPSMLGRTESGRGSALEGCFVFVQVRRRSLHLAPRRPPRCAKIPRRIQWNGAYIHKRMRWK